LGIKKLGEVVEY
jgi:hypothetical protein